MYLRIDSYTLACSDFSSLDVCTADHTNSQNILLQIFWYNVYLIGIATTGALGAGNPFTSW